MPPVISKHLFMEVQCASDNHRMEFFSLLLCQPLATIATTQKYLLTNWQGGCGGNTCLYSQHLCGWKEEPRV